MNIPIYRAKVIGLDNNYIIGFYQQYIEGFEDNVFHEINNTLIDQTTLAIHFPDMLDNHGNKIFASLSEDGKGGDCVFMENGYNETFCWDRLNACVVLKSRNYECRCFRNGSRNETIFNTYKIIGVQE